ncbi:MAG: hypothetical protein ACLTSL_04285 [Odoribacter splanchnicus]
MAIIENEIFQGARRRLGEFIIYQCRGKTCLRQRPARRTKRFSPGQLAQQGRIASVTVLYQATKSIGLHRSWCRSAEQTTLSGYNLFVGRNVPAFSGNGLICDFGKISLSIGELQLPDRMNISPVGKNEWLIEWQNDTPYPGTNSDDRLQVVLMKREDVFTIKIPETGDFRRKDCRAIIRLSPELKDYVHLYCYFCSTAGECFSESRYFCLMPKFLSYGYF